MSPTNRHAAVAAILATLLATPALAQADLPPVISVTGEASVSMPPDLALIDAGVTTEAKIAREAMEANNAAMGRVLSALKGAGLDEKDFQTSRLSLQPQYPANPVGRAGPEVVGYRASNHITIKVRDISKVANIIDAATVAGANDIGNISFTVSHPSKLLDNARQQALADARRKAEVYAEAAGVVLGAPLRISEGGAMAPLFRGRMAAAPMSATVPVATGEETLSVTVNVSWAIKPKEQ